MVSRRSFLATATATGILSAFIALQETVYVYRYRSGHCQSRRDPHSPRPEYPCHQAS
ncbi:twin-arginine translocation signal domain-containing protein [Marinobacter sp.]|uniref:twin-arginine translocation signal domain-containing protein n=1 Tax=Marinobacter sp. TaxID=50741 RepID=UPI003A5C2BF6